MKQNRKQGSIAVVMIIVTVLGIAAAGALFMTSGTRRLDKHSELKMHAWATAQSAVEEILIRMTNSDIAATETGLMKVEPWAAKHIAAANGLNAEFDKVEITIRPAQLPEGDPAEKQKFDEIMSVGPNFANPELFQDTTHPMAGFDPLNQRWVDFVKASAHPYHQALMNVRIVTDAIDPATGTPAVKTVSQYLDEDLKLEGYGNTYYNRVKEYLARTEDDFTDNNNNRAKGVRAALFKMEALPAPVDTTTELQVAAGETVAPDADVNALAEDLTEVGDAVGENVQARIDGCAGDLAYGFSALANGFILSGGADTDDPVGETSIEDSGRSSDNLTNLTKLATVSSTVTLTQGGGLAKVRNKQTVTAYRLVQQSNASKTAERLRTQMMVYLMFAYNVTPKKLVALNSVLDGNDAVAVTEDGALKAMPGLHTTLFERHNDLSGVRVVPFQAATCLDKIQKDA